MFRQTTNQPSNVWKSLVRNHYLNTRSTSWKLVPKPTPAPWSSAKVPPSISSSLVNLSLSFRSFMQSTWSKLVHPTTKKRLKPSSWWLRGGTPLVYTQLLGDLQVYIKVSSIQIPVIQPNMFPSPQIPTSPKKAAARWQGDPRHLFDQLQRASLASQPAGHLWLHLDNCWWFQFLGWKIWHVWDQQAVCV